MVTNDSDFLELGWVTTPHGGIEYLTEGYDIGRLVSLLETFALVHDETGFESQIDFL